ncbi:MAG: DUF2807 domain-containing protein [Bacteroidales bacterium]|jgi:hypothetical protein|nr:DUF2807 domain-containing protein [Bacteroidales bacterium]MDD3701932.1 DUF2807 domain-containing protein [Bacteroidales bacterium]MDY0369163.1 DUF2807 domain-containing protein [Bacteroidales bacterium]
MQILSKIKKTARDIVWLTMIMLIAASCAKDIFNTSEETTKSFDLEDFNAIAIYDNIDIEFKQANQNEKPRIEITATKNTIDHIIWDYEQDFQEHGFYTIEHAVGQKDTLNLEQIVCTYKRLILKNDKPFKNFVNQQHYPQVIIYFHTIEHIEYQANGTIVFSDPIELFTNDSVSFSLRFSEGLTPYIADSIAKTILPAMFMCKINEGSGDLSLKLQMRNPRSHSYLLHYYGTSNLLIEGKTETCYVFQDSYGPIDAHNFSSDFTFLTNNSDNHCYVHARSRLGATINGSGNVYYYGRPSITHDGFGSGQLIRVE